VARVGSFFVDLAPVCDAHDGDGENVVLDLVEHSEISDPDPPGVLFASELLAPFGARVGSEFRDGAQDPLSDPLVQLADFLGGSGGEIDRIAHA
jgi:hypothetical protein